MTTKEVADKYLEKYRELVKTANRNGLFLLVVILFSWLYLIETLNAQYLRSKKKALLEDRAIGYNKKVIKSRIRKIENSNARYIYGFSVINQANFDTSKIKMTIDSLQGKTGTGNLNYIIGLN